jgi:orotate phosphoribosyltransferase
VAFGIRDRHSALGIDAMTRADDMRARALQALQSHRVLMLNGHFDFGNGYHGSVYLHPHQLFSHPSRIWRFAQDLIDVLPGSVLEQTEVVAGPVTGGALLAHTMAGLLDSRRAISRPDMLFAPFTIDPHGGFGLSRFYQEVVRGRRVLLVDDIRNTGQTFARCAALVREGGGTVIATAEIYDRLESVMDIGVPNVSLAEYKAANYPADACPLCAAETPVTRF